ncbi:pyruvate dehydrogenase E1 component, alpha subunit [Sanguibacter keddieii DSM 10542]|uniref:Pyruvate dehydrogenase E1 component subunit alpha n=1 Tax=Sanguibacter keddieii (strain ATCC 51767 / DSM 10542 / NCFB 3025 / ST-74) TaxID=446469 RepID=D1BH88_SANKS|nr:pyruvate dehydrogenase (acetyl-transferring) E1 component subunit alpha [Sanguibacter keddieii]ACZ21808.1 pyruvate dehydrogenase E1 component, alpha subunit [Sanguibacter keddieii DSM 10542]
MTRAAPPQPSAAEPAPPPVDDQLDRYRQMLLVRRFEERAARAYTEAEIGGYCHLNLGEEATVVGLMAALEPTDYLFTNYREHGYALCRGISPGRIMAELYGRRDGVSGGWGGSMHLFDAQSRLLGGYGIVGGQLPLATGAALAVDYRSGTEVVMCLMGEGTTNIGAFHESLNIAALWGLPVVYVVVNNGTGMGTTVEQSSAEPEIFRRAASYRMASARVDGTDPVAVQHAAAEAVRVARSGRPYLLEATSSRLRGHSVVDPAAYRSPETVAAVRAADPVSLLAASLVEHGVTEESLAEIDREVLGVVAEAVAFAEASPHPDPSTLFDHTYATPVPHDSRRLPGDALYPAAPRPSAQTAPSQPSTTQPSTPQPGATS